MNSNPYLGDALASLSQSASVLRSLSFSSRAVLPRCVLASDDWFETHLIRDAAPHEIALFDPNPASYPVVQLELDDPLLLDAAANSGEAHRLAVAKRRAPKRANLTSTSNVGVAPTTATRNEPERCLVTAQKLLGVYAMPRAQEHVQALHAQLQGLLESISETEQALKRPPSRTAPQPQHDQSYYRRLELEDEIKREKLELLALEQIKADKQAEIEALAATAAAKAKPAPRSSFGSNGPAATAKLASNGPPVRSTRTPRISTSSSSTIAVSPRSSKEGTVPPRASTTTTTTTIRRKSTSESSPPQRSSTTAVETASSSSSSPARRPIGAGRPSVPTVGQSAMKRRVEAARARVQASAQATPNRREAFLSSSSTTSGREEEAGGLQDGKKKEDDELAPPIPVVRAATQATPPAAPVVAVEPPLPAGVTLSELEQANKTVWTTLGEASGLAAWARKWSAAVREMGGEKCGKEEEEEDSAANRKKQAGSDWRETLDILAFALAESASSSSSLPAGGTPNSPSGYSTLSFATSTTAAGGVDAAAPPPTWTPAQVVEARLCHLLLSTFAGRRRPDSSEVEAEANKDLPALNIILRETAIPLSTSDSQATSTGISSRKTPHLAMSVLKAHLGRFAKTRGWTEEMGTTAIYALVSKQTVKIDRRGREGAAVGFKATAAAEL
ncbi:hypothetical protein JCM8115_004247 [Rhodotorula mucilaginosa]